MSTTQVFFIHGGGVGGYEADTKMAASLQEKLGPSFNVRYPQMPNEDAPDFGWGQKIDEEIAAIKGEVILVGHSLGASSLLKYLSENKVKSTIRGVFLISTPFWSGDQEWEQGLVLREGFEDALPGSVPIFMYHSRDDEEVDVANVTTYANKLPQAATRIMASGGHQLGNDLTQVAQDIRNLTDRNARGQPHQKGL